MSKGVWPAVAGSIAQSQRLDAVANNLANVNTTGFKRDSVAFREIMSDAEQAAAKEDIPRQPYTDKDFHRLDGRDKSYVVVDGVYTDFVQGKVKQTGAALDIAIEGRGFLEVLTPQGVRFTRQGGLKLNADGALVTTEGHYVLARGGEAPADPDAPIAEPSRAELLARAIFLDEARPGRIAITKDGNMYQGRQQLAELSVVEFVDPGLLIKEGGSVFRNDVRSNLQRETVATNVRQGMLETSNVNPIVEMTEMLKATRLFEANQKVVKNYGDLEGRAVNDIGKL